ncbi:neuronal acetylcholine receptor subunit alpha-7-like isoform X15 [Rhodnius prolixus]|uniref:neuronal acetylcholine receptor subunit alpha-7-like isoform X15 n=1 Tax=Rhodnius prolixus TaxID=13249 RepID=UPI003D18C801
MSPFLPVILALTVLLLPRDSEQGPHEKRLLHTLLDHYNVLERPVANESDPLQLSFGLTLMQIIDVDEKNQIVTTNSWLNLDEKNQLLITNIWLKLEWNDVNLRWNASEFGGVKDLRIPPHRIWKPDVLMYNSADEGFDGTYPTNVVVRNNGSCLYVPPGIFKSTCKIDITWFPFDDQRCEMKFGSWTYDGFQLDLQLQEDSGGDISSFITNGEWDLLDVTVLLSLTFFLNMVAETMPPTSERPLIGTYFNCIMFMVASSVVSTIIILNYHHRNADTHEMSPCVKSLFLHWLPCILRMSRPGHSDNGDNSRKSMQLHTLELKERSSKSLLANVLDIDDDFRHGPLQASSHTFIRAHEEDGTGVTGSVLHSQGVSCLGPHRELGQILKELRMITDKLRKEDEAAEITNDWKFAAMVVDRLCLIIFTLFTVIATIAVLFSAPHIIVT